MRRFGLVVAYDGRGFHGWQRQPNRRTVQGVLEEGLCEVLQEKVRLTGAGRTDAGVHARGQVGSFSSRTRWPAQAVVARLRRVLPEDVRAVSARVVSMSFDARRSATGRRYAYRLLRGSDVLLERFAWCPELAWSADALVRATRPLEGRHDFSSFRSSGSSSGTAVCHVTRASWSASEGGARLDIVADHFLYRMVRNIVGTSLKLATTKKDPAAAMRRVLAAKDRSAAGPTAPAHGLTMEEVFYPAELTE